MAGDKVFDVYEGRLHTEKTQNELRERIRWIVDRVQGNRVLDIGCSQGLVPVLLGRKGKKVLGIDIDSDAIAYANDKLAAEDRVVRENVTFQIGDAAALLSSAQKFDTVVLTEVIEHLKEPSSFIRLAYDSLNEEGTVVISTPLGVISHPDHFSVFYMTDFLELVMPFFRRLDLVVIGKRICFAGIRKPINNGWKANELLEEYWSLFELEACEVFKNEDYQVKELARLKALIKEKQARNVVLQEKVKELASRLSKKE